MRVDDDAAVPRRVFGCQSDDVADFGVVEPIDRLASYSFRNRFICATFGAKPRASITFVSRYSTAPCSSSSAAASSRATSDCTRHRPANWTGLYRKHPLCALSLHSVWTCRLHCAIKHLARLREVWRAHAWHVRCSAIEIQNRSIMQWRLSRAA